MIISHADHTKIKRADQLQTGKLRNGTPIPPKIVDLP
jgi:hypothetical protein